MNKNDILNQFEKENKRGDEGERFQDKQAILVTTIVIILLSAVSICVTKDVKTFALIIGVISIGYGSGDVYRYIKIKKKTLLFSGILFIIVGLLFYLAFVANSLGWV